MTFIQKGMVLQKSKIVTTSKPSILKNLVRSFFEIATESPGFLIDEPLETLGTALKLPAQFEERRGEITAHLPKLTV